MIQNRIAYLDNLKGFLIILVVWEHCIQNLDPNCSHSIYFRFIYSFHIALFMFISRYVSYKEHITLSSVKRRFSQLMMPFFVWAIIKATIRGDAFVIIDTVVHPDRGLWFLYVLFFLTFLMKICDLIAHRQSIPRTVVVTTTAIVLLITSVLLYELYAKNKYTSKLLIGK